MNKNKAYNRKRSGNDALSHIFLIIVSVISVFPLYYMVVSSTNTSVDVLKARLLPGGALLDNLNMLLTTTDFLVGLKNSLMVSVVGSVLAVLITSLAGYAFEIYHDKAKDVTMSVLMLSIMVPQAVTLIPMYLLFAKLNLLNSVAGYILPFMSTAFLIMLFRQNTRSFPYEIVEAARIDGLSELQIFVQMFFPIMRPVFSTALIVAFMNIWNEYLWALVVMQSPESKTLQVVLAGMTVGYTMEYGTTMLLATIATIPLAIIFFCLQKSFTEGIAGSVKS
ncbi:MAG: carbohydrate ABC transporter permease [Lachnospiraceae bacterium]